MNVFVSNDKEPISVVKSLPDTIETVPSRSILELIGIDPILKLTKFCKKGSANIYAKVEFLNPSGSIKDTMVKYCIEAAEQRGDLKEGYTILEATSGNTGVATSMVAAVKGYKAVIVMPKGTSDIKKDMMRSFGADLVLTPNKEGIAGVVKKAKQLAKKQCTFFINQFENPDNPRSHLELGREILKHLGKDDVHAFVASVGTGGTLVGVARVLKKANPKIRIVAVEPKAVPVFYNMFYGKNLRVKKGIAHKIEGIGEGFVPKILEDNRRFVDEVLLVTDKDAIYYMKRLMRKEGLFVGMSSGANVWASMEVAKNLGDGKNVVTVFPDTGQRYLNSGIFKKR